MKTAGWSGFFLWLLTSTAQADVLLLVHGYLAQGQTWRESGVMRALQASGWQDCGQQRTQGGQVQFWPAPPPPAGHCAYTLDLPAEAPLGVQSTLLTQHIQASVQRHPGAKLHLAGHSAGGVAARLSLVQQPQSAVSTLITIASPHLGTGAADTASGLLNSPLSLLTPFVPGGGTLQRSHWLYTELGQEKPGNLLYWLNRQQHPAVRYVSLLRGGRSSLLDGITVPLESQDLRRVPALAGRAESYTSPGGHGLEASDGAIIANLLR
jgi:pimeloyl-ACP methyl ester carboxylesterase